MNDWIQILGNEFKGSTAKEFLDECLPCECTSSQGISSSFCQSDECINRALAIECDPTNCPCGSECQNQRFQKRLYPKLEIRQTPGKGHGLFTLEDLPPNSFVIEYIGEVLDLKAFSRRQRELDRNGCSHFYFMTLRASQVIDASCKGNLSRFINHSCNPNCKTEKWIVSRRLAVGIFTLKHISAGSELTFDYKFERFGSQAQKCLCGEVGCQGIIGKKQVNLLVEDENSFETHQETVDILSSDDDHNENDHNNNIKKAIIKSHTSLAKSKTLKPPQTTEEIRDLAISCMRISSINAYNEVILIIKSLLLVDQPLLLRRFVHFHGLMILKNILLQFHPDYPDLSDMILDLMLRLPVQTKNTIEDCKILSLFQENTLESNAKVQALISKWSTLERVYRIPKLKEIAPLLPCKEKESVYCLFSNAVKPQEKWTFSQSSRLEEKTKPQIFTTNKPQSCKTESIISSPSPSPSSQPLPPTNPSNIEGISKDEIEQIILRAKEKRAQSSTSAKYDLFDDKSQKAIKDRYRDLISVIVIRTLSKFRDQIPSSEAFKHLARKITHTLVEKEFQSQQGKFISALDEQTERKIKKYCSQKAMEFNHK